MKALIKAIAVAILAVGCASAQAGKNSNDEVLNGRWQSSVGSSWGGALTVTMTPPADGRFKGTVLFYSSACPWETPFDGVVEENGKLVFTTNLGGKCGTVAVELTPNNNGYTGTYRADFPDNGSVELYRK